MRTKEKLHEALILFTILTSLQDDKIGKDYPKAKKLVSGITTWKLFRRFSTDEYNLMVKIGEDKAIKALKELRISYLIYALELAKLWAINSKPGESIGVSKNSLKLGGEAFYLDMVKLKYSDPGEYALKKDIINDSIKVANEFYILTKGLI